MTNQVTQTPTLRIPGYPHQQDPQLIVWLEGSGNYSIIYLRDDPNPLMVCQTLKYFELRLPAFIRVSRSSLVNPHFVEQVIREDAKTMYLQLIGGLTIPVPRRRILATLARLKPTPARTV